MHIHGQNQRKTGVFKFKNLKGYTENIVLKIGMFQRQIILYYGCNIMAPI